MEVPSGSSGDRVRAKEPDLVDTVTYGNGTKIEYDFDDAERLTKIEHSVVGQPEPFLKMDYSYDANDLITGIVERDEALATSSVTYDYDNRGRLSEECRTGSHAYHLAYTYDQGGNRLTKTDWNNNTCTLYHYDTDAGSAEPHRNNRLMSYETFDDTSCTGNLVGYGRYDYAFDGRAAGNVVRVKRAFVIDWQACGAPWLYQVHSTCLKYNEQGEVWVATQQHIQEFNFQPCPGEPESEGGAGPAESGPTMWVAKSRQFRGIGRQRYMMRELDTSDPVWPTYDILPDTAVWTDYDGVWPTGDYTIASGTSTVIPGTDYETGFAEVDPVGQVSYMHTDQIGTLRGITDDTATVTTRPVYTAFGEPVFEDGAVGTRYRYAGAWGYESFGALDWGTDNSANPIEFPYLHVGHRHYDPATGRFLQRDPIGIRGGLNVHEYVASHPTAYTDSMGLGNDNNPGWFPGGIGTMPPPGYRPPYKRPLTIEEQILRQNRRAWAAGFYIGVLGCAVGGPVGVFALLVDGAAGYYSIWPL